MESSRGNHIRKSTQPGKHKSAETKANDPIWMEHQSISRGTGDKPERVSW